MAESISDLRLMFRIEARGAADCLKRLTEITRNARRTFYQFSNACDPLWAIQPGEWPDKFVLLNRYLRTGKRPPFIFNE